ncbi:MAG: glycosyltransferase [Atribacterota bacterium]
MDDILVSISCNTYNHEDYIADAIEGFLIQKTNFKFEILIHDDASTDKTAGIIRGYEKKYPDLIKPIYQTENQYSKGIRISNFNRERAIGKYIAICEGDDYWTDPLKLQKQVDFMEKNSDYSVCFHASSVIDYGNKKLFSIIRPAKTSRKFNTEDIIEGGGGFFPTNSIFYRKNMRNNSPDFCNDNTDFGDYQLMISLSLIGKVYYMDENMSIYRYNVPGSWTSRNIMDNQKRINHIEVLNDMLDMVNAETNYKYDSVIQKTKLKNEFNSLILQGRIKEIKKIEPLKNLYDSFSIKRKASITLKQYSSNLHRLLSKVLSLIRNIK